MSNVAAGYDSPGIYSSLERMEESHAKGVNEGIFLP